MITAPLYIELKTKNGFKKHYLNFNQFRNNHFQVNNKSKKEFNELMSVQLANKRFKGALIIEYRLYKGDNRKFDLANICSVVDKFFCDSLVKFNCIEDDNVNVIKEIRYIYAGVDKNKGRVEIEILKREY